MAVRMPAATLKKLFRQSHRESRLRFLRPGLMSEEEVRPLSLTAPMRSFITVRDFISQTPHEQSFAFAHHAPSVS